MALNLSAQHRVSLDAMIAADPTNELHSGVLDLKALLDSYDRGELNDEQLEAALEESLKTAQGMCHTMHLNLLGR